MTSLSATTLRAGLKCLALLICMIAAMLLPACSSGGGSYQDPTTQAMNDPMNYKPDMSDTDVSGGGTGEYRDKSFQRDVDHVLNP